MTAAHGFGDEGLAEVHSRYLSAGHNSCGDIERVVARSTPHIQHFHSGLKSQPVEDRGLPPAPGKKLICLIEKMKKKAGITRVIDRSEVSNVLACHSEAV